MTVDEKVELARRLAVSVGVKRNEWMRWAQYFKQRGNLDDALRLAEYMAGSLALRGDPKSAARKICDGVRNHLQELRPLSTAELNEVFGYVGRWLAWTKKKEERRRGGERRGRGRRR